MLLAAPVLAEKLSKPAWTCGTVGLANTGRCLSRDFSQCAFQHGDLRPGALQECWLEQCKAGLSPAEPSVYCVHYSLQKSQHVLFPELV